MPHDHHHDEHAHAHANPDWEQHVDLIESDGDTFSTFITDTAQRIVSLRSAAEAPVRRVLDIGSGPGVAACVFAGLFPEARVTAVDGSETYLRRAVERAIEHGLADRVDVHHTDLPDGLAELDSADVIWASGVLHHIGDQQRMLDGLRRLLDEHGLLAIAEFGDPMRFVPDDVDLGRPGLIERFDQAGRAWLAAMQEALPGAARSADYALMMDNAGLAMLDDRIVSARLDAPLSATGRTLALGHLRMRLDQVSERLDPDDRSAMEVLCDPDDPQGIMKRADAFLETSRRIMIAGVRRG
jgi:SAM-dependent methyltransferase